MENIINCLNRSGYDDLPKFQKDVRDTILNLMVDNSRPITYDEIRFSCVKKGMDIGLVNLTLSKFDTEQYFIAEDEEVLFMYPVSSSPTMHKVTLADGRSFCAMCAIDALGSVVTFDQDISINSMCMMTEKPININIIDGSIDYTNDPELRVLHVNISKYQNWASSC